MKIQNLFDSNDVKYASYIVDKDSIPLIYEGYYLSLIMDKDYIPRLNTVIGESAAEIKIVDFNASGQFAVISNDYDALTKVINDTSKLSHTFSKIEYYAGKDVSSFDGFPKIIKSSLVFGKDCNLVSLKGIHKHISEISGSISIFTPKVQSHFLGILKIKGCKSILIDNKAVENIINKYLPEGDILDCQDELIEAGLEEYAKL